MNLKSDRSVLLALYLFPAKYGYTEIQPSAGIGSEARKLPLQRIVGGALLRDKVQRRSDWQNQLTSNENWVTNEKRPFSKTLWKKFFSMDK